MVDEDIKDFLESVVKLTEDEKTIEEINKSMEFKAYDWRIAKPSDKFVEIPIRDDWKDEFAKYKRVTFEDLEKMEENVRGVWALVGSVRDKKTGHLQEGAVLQVGKSVDMRTELRDNYLLLTLGYRGSVYNKPFVNYKGETLFHYPANFKSSSKWSYLHMRENYDAFEFYIIYNHASVEAEKKFATSHDAIYWVK